MSFQMFCINKTQDFQYTIKIGGQYATYKAETIQIEDIIFF